MRMTPYILVSRDYWRQPREVCVVDEIKCLPDEDAEILVGGTPSSVGATRVKRWLGTLPIKFTETAEDDELGPYTKFICKPLRAAVDPVAHALNELAE